MLFPLSFLCGFSVFCIHTIEFYFSIKYQYRKVITIDSGNSLRVFLSSCLPRISGQPAQQRQNQSSDGVSERHHKNIEQRTQTPHTADRKEIHIRDAVLEAAENKRHHAEKQSQIFADFVRVMLKAVYSDKNQQIAEDCEQKAAA